MMSNAPLRRSMRISSSSVRYPSETRSPTPGKIRRKPTPGRLPLREHSGTPDLKILSSDDEDDDNNEGGRGGLLLRSLKNPNEEEEEEDGDDDDDVEIVRPGDRRRYPKVFLLNPRGAPESPSLLERVSQFSSFPPERILWALALLAFLLISLLYYGFPPSFLSSENFRFAVMVAPEFLMGMMAKIFLPYHENDLYRPSSEPLESLPDLDLIVNKILSNEKFENFIVELENKRQKKAASSSQMSKDALEKFVLSLNSHERQQRESLFKESLLKEARVLKEEIETNRLSAEMELRSIKSSLSGLSPGVREDAFHQLETSFLDLSNKVSKVEESFARIETSILSCRSNVREINSKLKGSVERFVNEVVRNESSPFISGLKARFVSKDQLDSEVEKFKSDLKNQFKLKSSPVNEFAVERIVQDALNKYDADKTGMFDFALESAGGSIKGTPCTDPYELSQATVSVFGFSLYNKKIGPEIILQPVSSPGNCWAFKGSQGSVLVGLRNDVKIAAFSLEHIPKILTPTGDILSAPKRFSVLGLTSTEDSIPIQFGNFTYNDNGTSVQTFFTSEELPPVKLVKLEILSNYGNLEYTCIYRFRVHGVNVPPHSV